MELLRSLSDKHLISRSDAIAIQKETETTGESIESLLVKRGVDASDLFSIKGEYLKIPTVRIGDEQISFEVLKNIPEESALHYRFVPLALRDGILEVGAVDPDSTEALDAVSFISARIGLPFKVFLVTEADFNKVLQMYKGLTGEVSQAISELDTSFTVEAPTAEELKREGSRRPEEKITEDAPVTKIVATILRYAAEGNASDIHIEPWRENVRVRFRVDGVMNTSLVLPYKIHSAVVSRIKILCNMRLDEKRKPQDGRFTARIEGRKIDFRVST